MSTVTFTAFPRTEPPAPFIASVITAFQQHEGAIGTVQRPKGLTSDEVLATIRPNLCALGFKVEEGKKSGQVIRRPVFFGEQGKPTLTYRIDAYQDEWQCGLEVEAGRALMGNAFYRDLVQALVMVNVNHLILAVPINYKFKALGKPMVSKDYAEAVGIADALYGHSRIQMPYRLTVVGY